MNDNKPHLCDVLGCRREATHHLRLRCWGHGERHSPGTVVEAQIPRPLLCHEHAYAAQLDGVITVEGWQSIQRRFIALGRKPPETGDDVQLYPREGMPTEPQSIN